MGSLSNEEKAMFGKLKDTVGIGGTQTKQTKIELLNEQDKIEASFQKLCAENFMCFVRGLHIAFEDSSKMFDICMAPYQRDCFEELAPNLQALRNGKNLKKKRFWIERTKKGGKDSDLGLVLLWLIAFPRRPFYAQVGAANKEQASIVKKRILHLLHWNPWLNNFIEIVQWEVRSKKKLANGSPMATLDIMSTEISGSHGGTPDLLVINELSHMTKWEFAENLMDNVDGTANAMAIIATNAGFKGTKAEIWRNNAIDSEEWSVHLWTRPAPWHDKASIDDARNRNSPSRFKRLWYGKWVSGKGDALDENDIDQCFNNLMKGPISEPEDGWFYIGGLDLSVSNHHSGLMILGINVERQLLKTVWWRRWKPTKKEGGKIEVDLMDIERTCITMSKQFRLSFLFYDPSQAVLMAQRLRKQGVPAREMSFQKQGNMVVMANSLLQVIETGKLQCYDDEERTLRGDFGKFSIVEKSFGYRLEAVSDELGHADVGTALVICLPFAVDMLEGVRGLLPDDDLVYDDDQEMTEEELDNMPQEFKDLFDMYDEMDDEHKDHDWEKF